MSDSWAPGADAGALEGRARLLRTIREFFFRRDVMEVVTPVLGARGVSDVHIDNIAIPGPRYLQTSPEYFLKRMLAAGAGPVYQMGPVFRGGESGRRHNVEFTMLEWYRPGYTLSDLIDEVCALLVEIFGAFDHAWVTPRRHRYKDLFQQRWTANPHKLDAQQLKALTRDLPSEHIPVQDEAGAANDYLDLLFSQGVEPGLTGLNVVEDYPAAQAALAEVGEDAEGDRVAFRFECIWEGIELANGYRELRDPDELRARMTANNLQRRLRALPAVEPDEKLLAALPHMPPCAGVALGVDRLLMLLLGRGSLDEVIAFSDARL